MLVSKLHPMARALVAFARHGVPSVRLPGSQSLGKREPSFRSLPRPMRLICFAVPLLVFGSAIPLLGQSPPKVVYLGIGAGLQAVPSAYAENCGALRGNDPVAASGAEVRAGIPLSSAVSVEARSSIVRLAEQTCTLIFRGHSQGIHRDRYRASEYRSRLLASDLRLRYEPYAPWVFTGGAGWTWSHGDAYLAASMGWRGGRRVRALLDAEITGHRISTRVLTREWRDHEVIEVLEERADAEWRMGLGFRLGLEVSLR